MTSDPDADLREHFREMRTHDRAAAPEFDGLLARVPARASRGVPGFAWAAGGVALVAAVVLVVVLHSQPAATDGAEIALPAWHSPTDFLLASADDSLHRLSWQTLPTSRIGEPSFNRYLENR